LFSCQNLPNIPGTFNGSPTAGLTFENNPYIDGTDGSNAWIFQGGAWLPTTSLPLKISYGGVNFIYILHAHFAPRFWHQKLQSCDLGLKIFGAKILVKK